MTLPGGGVPIKLGTRSAKFTFWGFPRNPGDPPSRIGGTFTLIGPEGDLTLDVFIGPQGEPGTPMAPFEIEWDSTVTVPGDLPAVETLDDSDNGRAWVIGTSIHVYHDGEYHIIDAGIPGPKGDVPEVTMTAHGVDWNPDDPYVITVTQSGPSDSPNFDFEIPMRPGPEGPSAAVETAADVDVADADWEIGNVLAVTSADPHTLGLISPTWLSPKIYTIPHINFIEHTGNEPRFLIASLSIPAQDFDWYPDVAGHVRIQTGALSTTQVEIEVRCGDTGIGDGTTAPLCGLAPFDPGWALLDSVNIANILPHFSDTADPSRALAPDAEAGLCLAGDAKTFYVFIHKIGGLGQYYFTNPNAQLRLMILPANLDA